MKLIAPNNIFSTIFYLSIPEEKRPELILKDSSLITNELLMQENNIALIPSLDLINHRDLFVSSKIAIGFDAELSNSYLYFSSNDSELKKISLKGDISSNEVILSKIIFKETYNIQPQIELDTHRDFSDKKNYLLSGNLNWNNDKFKTGVSFAEQIALYQDHHYLNYLLAANKAETLNKFHSDNSELSKRIKENFSSLVEGINFNLELNNFLISNQDSIEFSLDIMKKDSYSELLKLLYYHQIIDDIFDVKFV
jgi:hypothetical protein